MPGIRGFCALFAAGLALALPAAAKPPIEAFSSVGNVRAMDISPDGKKLAYLSRIDGKDYLMLQDIAAKQEKALSAVNNLKPIFLRFVSDNYIVLVASEMRQAPNSTLRYEYTGAFAYNLSTNKAVQLLSNTPDLVPQSGLGIIVGVDPDGSHVYMPAYVGGQSQLQSQGKRRLEAAKDLLRVDLETGKGKVPDSGYRGNPSTRDWLVNSAGKPLAREDYAEATTAHTFRSYAGDEQTKIYDSRDDTEDMDMSGVSSDGQSIVTARYSANGFLTLNRMSLADGKLTGPLFEHKDADADAVVVDNNRVVYGVRYSGMKPSYEMFDKAVEKDINDVLKAFPNSAVQLDSWSRDWSKLLFIVSGGTLTERYVLLDRPTHVASIVARARPNIKPEEIGEVITIEYKAADGLKIPALVTWPAGVPAEQRKNLPLVVMPHGGPASYDQIRFDALAQFVANEGYVVLQPNFRGSAGFGREFQDAGAGEWGRKMQSDITDGVNALATIGWADKNRVCIFGWSYGGYAALAGGALTPDLYKCVVSIAGVSNLKDMLAYEVDMHGLKSRTVIYWREVIGDPYKDGAAIDAVSPARLAKNFTAPVLLIHGADDWVVPPQQSDQMNNALKGAGKPVEYVKIPGDDHNLLDPGSRQIALSKVAEFLAKYLK